MAIPYVTEAKARMIAQEVVKESIIPTPAGGTKLYKHVTTMQVTDNYSGESFLAKIIFILTSDKSLKGTRIETPLKRGYISGYITLGSAAAILLGIPTWYQEEEKFIYADWDGSLTYLKPSDGYEYLSDDVTEL